MYLSIVSTIFSILFILTGVAGFIPGFYENSLLFGKFQFNTVHSVFYIIVGIIGLVCSLRYSADRRFFQVFGIIFGILAISGAAWGNLWGLAPINISNTVIHTVIAVVFLVIGFSADKTGQV